MFGFRKKQSKADAALTVMDSVIDIASDKWRHFCDALPFRADVPLADLIAAFAIPFGDGARANIPEFRDAPDALLFLVAAKGIERSGTHTRAQIEQALGVQLPD